MVALRRDGTQYPGNAVRKARGQEDNKHSKEVSFNTQSYENIDVDHHVICLAAYTKIRKQESRKFIFVCSFFPNSVQTECHSFRETAFLALLKNKRLPSLTSIQMTRDFVV